MSAAERQRQHRAKLRHESDTAALKARIRKHPSTMSFPRTRTCAAGR
jgi:hypothetical protein